jgi:rod shape-determining protein MreD
VTLAVMIVAVVCAGVFQGAIPTAPLLGEARAPFLAGVVIYYALMRERHVMLTAAVLAGIAQDGLGMMPLGYSCFCFVLAGLVVAQFSDIVFRESLLTTSLFGAITAACMTAGLNIMLNKSGLVDLSAGRLCLKILGSAVLGLFATPVAFAFTLGLERVVGNVAPRKEQPCDEIYFT